MPTVEDFTPVFPFTIDATTLDEDIDTRALIRFADDLMETLDEMYGDEFAGATGNITRRHVTAFFKLESDARQFARMWHNGRKKVLEEQLRTKHHLDDNDIPF